MLLKALTAAAFLTVMVLAVLGSSRYRDIYQVPLLMHDATVLEQGWTLTAPDGTTQDGLAMPLGLEYREDGDYVLVSVLPDRQDYSVAPVLFFVANHLDFTLYLDGEPLYEYRTEGRGFSKTPGNTFHMILMPEDYGGRELRIELHLLLEHNVAYTVPTPLLAPKATIVNHLFRAELPSLVLISIIFSIGCIMLVLNLAFRKTLVKSYAFLHTGFFAILFSGYAVCDTEVIHLIIASSYTIHLFTFLLLALLPIPFLQMLKESASTSACRAANGVILLALLNFAAQLPLHFLKILDIRESLPATHAVIVAAIAVFVYAMVRCGREKRASRNRFLLATIPMVAGAVVDLVLFYLPVITENSFFFQAGMLVFIVTQLVFVVRSYLAVYDKNVRVEFYEHMAFTDSLTGVGNRAAFEARLTEIGREREKHLPVWCVSADVNNLKQVNDSQGHMAGDRIISAAAEALQAGLGKGTVYRVGGDEFVALVCGVGREKLEEALLEVGRREEAYNRTHEIPLSLAVGCDGMLPTDSDLEKMVTRADSRMYREKKRMKQGE